MPGVVSLARSFGSLAHWHPHIHLVVTDGAFRRDGSFVAIRTHDAEVDDRLVWDVVESKVPLLSREVEALLKSP